MASVTSKEIPEEFAMFGELFNFFKKFYHPEDEDAYWEAVVRESGELHKKYHTDLSKELILAVLNEFERKYHNKGVNKK